MSRKDVFTKSPGPTGRQDCPPRDLVPPTGARLSDASRLCPCVRSSAEADFTRARSRRRGVGGAGGGMWGVGCGRPSRSLACCCRGALPRAFPGRRCRPRAVPAGCFVTSVGWTEWGREAWPRRSLGAGTGGHRGKRRPEHGPHTAPQEGTPPPRLRSAPATDVVSPGPPSGASRRAFSKVAMVFCKQALPG